jgi:uncharacterized protein with von Willebrand factor type A (vWA) domain
MFRSKIEMNDELVWELLEMEPEEFCWRYRNEEREYILKQLDLRMKTNLQKQTTLEKLKDVLTSSGKAEKANEIQRQILELDDRYCAMSNILEDLGHAHEMAQENARDHNDGDFADWYYSQA